MQVVLCFGRVLLRRHTTELKPVFQSVGWLGARLTARRQGQRALCRWYGGATREHVDSGRVVARALSLRVIDHETRVEAECREANVDTGGPMKGKGDRVEFCTIAEWSMRPWCASGGKRAHAFWGSRRAR